MQRIVSHIEYLLDRHECVIVPGFGAFISSYKPASIDTVNHTIMPPHRAISFNAELTHDDGLLASSYARALSIPYTAAVAAINEDVEFIKSVLNDGGEFRIGLLGNIHVENNSQLIFSPESSTFTSAGLKGISLEVKAKEELPVAVTELQAPTRYNRTIHRIMRYAAMLVILFGVGIVLSTPLTSNTESSNVIQASLCPIETSTATTEPEDVFIPEFLISEPQIEEPEIIPATDNYCLVIASLATIEQANRFVSQAGNDAMGMFESNGRYRVYALTGPDAASVRNEQLEARYSGAWPCAMPRD